jgi:hypothetical protein
MDSNSMAIEEKNIHDLTDVYEEINNVSNQEVIVVDGRGYEDSDKNKNEILTLIDVIEDAPAANNLHEEIVKRSTEIAERIAREIIPEIAERVIKEEIERLKKISNTE